MRFAPAAAALSLALALTASVSWGAQRDPSPRAAVLIAQGQASLDAGDTQAAIDAYEAALTVDPAYTPVLIRLAEAARQEQLQGKAIRYYRNRCAAGAARKRPASPPRSPLGRKSAC